LDDDEAFELEAPPPLDAPALDAPDPPPLDWDSKL